MILIWRECVKGEKQSTYIEIYHFCFSSFICSITFYPLYNSWVGKIPWRRKWQSTPVFLSGKFHGQRSLAGCSPWGHKELDITKYIYIFFFFSFSSVMGLRTSWICIFMSSLNLSVHLLFHIFCVCVCVCVYVCSTDLFFSLSWDFNDTKWELGYFPTGAKDFVLQHPQSFFDSVLQIG